MAINPPGHAPTFVDWLRNVICNKFYLNKCVGVLKLVHALKLREIAF